MLKDSLFVMPLIDGLDNVDLEIWRRSVVQAFSKSSKSNYSMSNSAQFMALLQDDLSPERARRRAI